MNWKTTTLGDISLKVQSGGTPRTTRSDFYGGDIDWVKTKEVNFHKIYSAETKITPLGLEKSSAKMIPKNSILIAMYGNGETAGRCAMNMIPVATNQACCNFTFNEEVADPLFMFYKISNHYIDFVNLKSGGAQLNLNGQRLKEFKISLPPLQTQKRIADILSAYDDLIENNLKRIKLLEQAAQNIYKEWFVNLRFPGYENAPINEETGLPVGWENSELDSVATVQSSKRVFLADYVDNGVPFYRGKEISQKVKHEAVSEPYFISHEKFREFDNGFGSPKENDILITAVGTIGNCYLVRNSDLPFYFKDGNLLWIHSYNETVSGFYLIQYFQSPIFKGVLNSITIGSSQKALTIKAVKKLNITVPNNEILEKFDSIIKTTMKQIEVLANTMTQLKAARDILLPRLMNRTIEVE